MMKVQMDQTCDAVKSTAPQEMWGETSEKLEELETASGGARRRHGLLQ